MPKTILAQFKSESGESKGAQVELPVDVKPAELQAIYDALLQVPADEKKPYLFFINGIQIKDSIATTRDDDDNPIKLEYERIVDIVFAPQAIFKVEPVSRCVSSMAGHGQPVIAGAFSPDGRGLASGSGDTTLRFWDIGTQTPKHVCQSHRSWVLAVAWSPDATKVASGCKIGEVNIWCPKTGAKLNKTPLIGHNRWITALAWEPINLNPNCTRIASSSKDTTIRIWNIINMRCELALSGHSASVTCVRWSANGLIYSSSQDRSIKVWRGSDGVLCRSLDGHAHWVNTLALSCEAVVRTGAFDPLKLRSTDNLGQISREEMAAHAQKRYDDARSGKEDTLVSASDDCTMFLWQPESSRSPTARLTGHQQVVIDVKYSPDMRFIASASFDKSIRIWNGQTGKFVTTLRGHVQKVYQLAWSADSRLLASGSADSTCKIWNISGKNLIRDLPGHSDEIYVIDWSPTGEFLVSAGKDKLLKIWRQ